jgi:hypothetical protein
MTRLTCVATTPDGERCQISSGLCPGCSKCLWHDPCRTDQAAEARVRGGKATSKVRVVGPDAVPPLNTLDDAVAASAWLFRMGVCGELDPATVREGNRSVTTFKDAINKRDLLARIRQLERQLRALEKARGT